MKTKWLDCGEGTLRHPNTGNDVTLDVVELEGFGRIFEVFHYGNDPEGTQRLILAAPELLATLKDAQEILAVALSWDASDKIRRQIKEVILKAEGQKRAT